MKIMMKKITYKMLNTKYKIMKNNCKRWTKEDSDMFIELIKNKKTYCEIAELLNRSETSIKMPSI